VASRLGQHEKDSSSTSSDDEKENTAKTIVSWFWQQVQKRKALAIQ